MFFLGLGLQNLKKKASFLIFFILMPVFLKPEGKKGLPVILFSGILTSYNYLVISYIIILSAITS